MWVGAVAAAWMLIRAGLAQSCSCVSSKIIRRNELFVPCCAVAALCTLYLLSFFVFALCSYLWTLRKSVSNWKFIPPFRFISLNTTHQFNCVNFPSTGFLSAEVV